MDGVGVVVLLRCSLVRHHAGENYGATVNFGLHSIAPCGMLTPSGQQHSTDRRSHRDNHRLSARLREIDTRPQLRLRGEPSNRMKDTTMDDATITGWRRAARTSTAWLGGLMLAVGFSVALLIGSGTAYADSTSAASTTSSSDSHTSSPAASERDGAEDADDRSPHRDRHAANKSPDSAGPAADDDTTTSTPDAASPSDDSDDSSEEDSPSGDETADTAAVNGEDADTTDPRNDDVDHDSDGATAPQKTAPEVEQPAHEDPATGREGASGSRDDAAVTERLSYEGESTISSPATVAPAAASTLNTGEYPRLAAPTSATAPPSLTALTPPQALQALLAWAGQELHTALTAPWQDPQFVAAAELLQQRINDFFGGFTPGGQPPSGTTPSPPPSPTDVVPTPFGDIGKWMLRPVPPPPHSPPGTKPTWAISDWLNQEYGGRQLLEPINVVVIDRTSTTAEESTQKLITTLSTAGFPIRVKHSTGYQAWVDGSQYAQEPTGANEAFSNCFYIFPNDHARFFGPAPTPLPDGTGFVWTAALSRERVGIYDWSFTHRYVSFQQARNTLRDNLISNGATDLGMISLDNAVNSPTQFTGDHDGYAAVVELT
jgi:hypothetical protein